MEIEARSVESKNKNKSRHLLVHEQQKMNKDEFRCWLKIKFKKDLNTEAKLQER